MNRAKWIFLILAAALVVIGAGMLASRRDSGTLGPAPAGQPAVAQLVVGQLQKAFNAAADQTRLLVTFSPT